MPLAKRKAPRRKPFCRPKGAALARMRECCEDCAKEDGALPTLALGHRLRQQKNMTVFPDKGPANTENAVRLAIEAARQHNIGHIVVASNTGSTARLFLEEAQSRHIVCVTHACGFRAPGEMEISREERALLQARGVDVLTTTHVLSGAERGLSRRFQGIGPVEVMAKTLYMLGQGAKVCVEIAVMALDAGLIPYGEDIVAVGGTGRGADSVLILAPSHASSILETRIRAIVCKPWDC